MNRTTRQTFVAWIAALLAPLTNVYGADKSLRTDIEYAKVDDVSLKLDAHIPEGSGPFPAVIVVHGGGFTGGNKQVYVTPILEPLSRGGFAWFSIDYRLAPKYPFPAAIEDIDRAIEFVKAHAAEYKIDPERIALLGESAGGHLVSYVGTQTDPRFSVAAVVSFYGPHNLMGEIEMRKKQKKAPTAMQCRLSWGSKTSTPLLFSGWKRRLPSITSMKRCRPICSCTAPMTTRSITSSR